MDDLERFKDWWLTNRPINTPPDSKLVYVADTNGLVLYREGQYQVELFSVKPNSTIKPHVHPNVDSYEVYIAGDIVFTCDGLDYAQKELGATIRVRPDSWHSGIFGNRGGVFLSIQKWGNDVHPKFVGDDWKDKDGNKSYCVS